MEANTKPMVMAGQKNALCAMAQAKPPHNQEYIMEATVSAFLSMQGALNLRRTQLNELKNAATEHSYSTYGGDPSRKDVKEPTYDIKKVDKKLVEINKALFHLDSKIKEANARTNISVDIKFDELMSEIE
jgi:hypothetical protein